jgi:2-polyprenyl-3-methyl-5-hydroxy-6-metoxy-1,4-benzoquinol methylase
MATNSSPREVVACDLCGKDDAEPLLTKNSYRIVRCRACGLVYVNPRPRTTALAALYDEDSFQHNQATRAEDDAWRKIARARLDLIDREKPDRGRLLDVGCSTGLFMDVAQEGGWKVSGIDLSVGSINYSKKRGFDARLATIETQDFAPGTFDAITMFDSIEHMPSPMRALRIVSSLLAPGGVVMITTPNIEGLFPQLTWKLLGRTVGAWEHPGPPGHIYQFGRSTMTAALDRTGFRILHDGTEPIPYDYTVGALVNSIYDSMKGKSHRPRPSDADVDLPPPPRGADPHGNGEPEPASNGDSSLSPSKLARRALRATIRTAAWALVGGVSMPAAKLGRGDSLVMVARKL